MQRESIPQDLISTASLAVAYGKETFAVFASIIALGAGTALAARGRERVPARRCGTTHFDATAEAKTQQLIKTYSQQAAVEASPNRSIPVYWHTITDGPTGSIPPSQIQAQIHVLNEDYAPSGYVFHLVHSDSTDNSDWFHHMDDGTPQERGMKSGLRAGGADALNIYTMGFNDVLGFSVLPQNYSVAPWKDGVVLHYATLPGGSFAPFNLGRTATHEVGHWLGLYHVFEGGCSGDGDFVSDTPPQNGATSGCPTSKDTCPGGGVDSIHNFME
ncbi:unnamed protein product [Tilletia controversa]|nr:unnamed protein product [Tilletia controversa]